MFSVAGSEEPDVAVKTEEAQVENESPELPVIEGKVDNPGSIFQVYMDCSPRFQNSVSLEK